MQHVIIVIHLMVVTALVVVVLYQKSEGGALGMGQSGLFSGRGQANALTRATSILATIFFMTSIALTVLPAWERRAKGGEDWTTAIDQPKVDFKEVPAPGAAPGASKEQPAGDGKESIFDQLKKAQEQRQKGTQPSATAPATPAPSTPAPSATAPTTAPAPAQPTTPAVESQKPELRPTQDAPAATLPETPKPEADTKAPAVNNGSAPAASTIWKSPTQ